MNLGWEPCRGPFGHTVWDVARSSTGVLIAVTEERGILRSSNNGETWDSVRTNLHNSNGFYSVCITASNIMLAGTKGAVCRSFDDGQTWDSVAVGGTERISALAVRPDGALYAGTRYARDGGSGRIYVSTDTGNTWRQDTTYHQAGAVYRILCCGPRYTLFGTSGEVLRTVGESGLVRIAIYTFSLLWGDSSGLVFCGHHQYVQRSRDSGNTFPDTILRGYDVTALAPLSNGTFVAGTATGILLHSSDNGTTWIPASGMSAGSAIKSFFERDAQTVWAITESDGFLLSTDNGNSWTARTGISIRPFGRIELSPTGDVCISRSAYSAPCVSTDKGRSWRRTQASIPSDATYGSNGQLYGVDPCVYSIASDGSLDSLACHVDSCITGSIAPKWEPRQMNCRSISTPVPGVLLVDGSVAWTNSDRTGWWYEYAESIFRYDSKDSNWRTVYRRGCNPSQVRTWLWGWSRGGAAYQGYYVDYALLLSTDGGLTWNQCKRPPPVVSITGPGGATFFAADLNGLVLRSSNTGGTWDAVFDHTSQNEMAVRVHSLMNGWLAVGTNTGHAYLSADAGASWWNCSQGLSGDTVLAIAQDSSGLLYVSTNSEIFRSAIPPNAVTDGAGVLHSATFNIFPNPVSDDGSLIYIDAGPIDEFSVVNAAGSIILHREVSQAREGYLQMIPRNVLAPGAYVCSVRSKRVWRARSFVVMK